MPIQARHSIRSNRLLALSLAPGSGLADDLLLPQELTGTEGVSEGFTYTLTCLSTDAFLELKQFIGMPIQLGILTDDGSRRALCGLVTRAEQQGSDGGFSRYALSLQDPFAVFAKRINSRVFQDLNVRELVALVLQEHRKNNSVLAACFDIDDRCRNSHPAQSWITQYNESDTDFLCRWLAQEGISWYIEHGDAGVPGEHPKLTLVLFDDVAVLQASSAAKVRFHRDDGTEAEDSITEWNGMRTLQPGSIHRASFEYKAAITNAQHDRTSADHGAYGMRLADTLEDYRYDSHHTANDEADYARYARLRSAAHDAKAKFFSGTGSHRELAVGRHFELTQHPVHDHDAPEDRHFTILRNTLHVRNNLADSMQERTGSAAEPVYQTRFDAMRKGIPIVPAYSGTAHAKPVAPPMLTATVVGPAGEEIHVNAYGCIKVRMPFTRSQDHAHAEGAGATDSDRDSVWIRVAQPWTGRQYGHLWIPRVGDEVGIQFINDDIDRPIVVRSVYNGTHRPATFSDAGELPGNKALSGIKSKMVKGRGTNEIVWDDSTAEQRIRVATDHGQTALNAGYLVHPRTGGKGMPRGEGIELRTDQYGTLRAARGMLITTDARADETSAHLDSKELSTQLKGSLDMAKALSDVANAHNADPLDANKQAQQVLRAVEAAYSQSGGTGQKAEVPGYAEPLLAFSSPAGIISATPKAQQIAAGEDIHLSSQEDTNFAVGNSLSIAIKKAWSVFVATAGIKLFAGKGKVQIQAQDNAIEATAKKDVAIAAVTGDIDFTAAKSITITAGGCQVRIADGQITFKAPGPVNIHGSVKNLTGPAQVTPNLPQMPKSICIECLKKSLASGVPFTVVA